MINQDNSQSSGEEDSYNDYITNPQKRKEFDQMKLYQQQKELQKMSGLVKDGRVEAPQRMKDSGQPSKSYATVSLLCLTVTNPFRDFIMKITFNILILLIIIANCVFLAIDDPNLQELPYQVYADFIFLCLFTAEMVFKIIAMGFVTKPYSYLRDGWNILDFIVVVMGWISKVVSSNNVSAIRVIRILRPLRTINSIPTMRKLVQSLLNSLPTLFDIFVLFLFFLIMFGTVGTQLFGGLNDYRCFTDNDGNFLLDSDGNDIFCQINPDGTDNCPSGVCGWQGAPEWDTDSFDNIFKSCLSVFVIITLEGWTDRMYLIRRATGVYYYDIYFLLIVIIGVFFILNLMVAVQFSYFDASFAEAQKQLLKSKPDPVEIDESPLARNDSEKEGERKKQDDDFSQAIYKITENRDQSKSQLYDSQVADLQKKISQQKEQQKKKKKKCQCPIITKFRAKVLWLVESRSFNIFIMILILFNTTFMAMEHYEQSQLWTQIIDTANSILTCLFAGEMVLKLIGMGFRNYVRDSFNDFDAIIVIIGLLEFLNAGSKAITVLRSFRLLRIFKIVKSWKALKKILQTVLKAFSSITNLGLLIFLLSFIYSLIGMQFLSGPIPIEEIENYRQDFNTFTDSILMMFILLTAENWNSTLTQYINLQGYSSTMFFVTNIIFANIMLLNMFVAILISYISDNMEDEEEEKQVKSGPDVIQGGPPAIQGDQQNEENQPGDEAYYNKREELVEETLDFIQERMRIKASLQNHNNQRQAFAENQSNTQNGLMENGQASGFNIDNSESQNQQVVENVPNEFLPQENQEQLQVSKFTNEAKDENTNDQKKSMKTKKKQAEIIIIGKSLFILPHNSKFRLSLKRFIENTYFENFIYHMIALNTFILALNEPANTDPYQNSIIDLIVNIISGVFVAEAVLKIIVMGFVIGKNTYLRDTWNVLDFIIVSFSVLTWILDSVSNISVSFLRGFRALRALRPLRMVSKNEGMKVLVDSLLVSIPQLINVLLISLLFFFVFGILGVQLFKGSMSFCNDSNINFKSDCIGQYDDPDNGLTDRQWITPFINYDNILFSTNTFFEICNLENWPAVLFATIDSVGYDQAPKLGNRPWVALIFVIFIFITSFFVMNLFTSVIVDKFNEEMKKKEGSHSFSDEQREWVKMQRVMMHVKLKILPVMPKNQFRKLFFNIVTSPRFEYLIMAAIALNTVFICLDYYNSPENYSMVIDYANYVFVGIFGCEALFKLIAHGKFYFLDSWNVFDFTIVVLSFITIDQDLFPFKVTALRIIRVARLLRMIKVSKGLRHLLKTLWLAVGNVINVALLLCLVYSTYAIAGMDLFGNATMGDQIVKDANFQKFYLSFAMLFRCESGENWNGLMHNYYDQYGIIAYIYFVTFQFLSHYILINVLVAVVYDSFNDVQASEDDNEVLSLKRKDIKAFVKTWAIFCPNGEHYMKTSQLSAFLMKLPPPLGYEGHKIEQSKLNKIIFCLNIKNHIKENQGKVYFPEVMWCIFHSIVGNNDEQVHKCEQVLTIMSILKRKYKGLGKNVTPDSLCGNKYYRTEMSVSKYLCAMQIYKNWIKYKDVRERVKAERLQKAEKEKQALVSGTVDVLGTKPMSGQSLRVSENSISVRGYQMIEEAQKDKQKGLDSNIAGGKATFALNQPLEEEKDQDRAKDGLAMAQMSELGVQNPLKSMEYKSVSLSTSSLKSEQISQEDGQAMQQDYRQGCCSHGEECQNPNCKHVYNEMSYPTERLSSRAKSQERLQHQDGEREGISRPRIESNFNFELMKGRAAQKVNEVSPNGFFKQKIMQKASMEEARVRLEREKNE